MLIQVAHGFAREGAEGALEGQNVSLPVRVNAIGKKNPECVGGGIDPNASPGETSVAVGTERKNLAARTAVTGVDVPAQSAMSGNGVRGLDAGHELDGRGFKYARAIKLAQIEQHSGVSRQIRSGGKQAGVSRHSAHAAGGRIVHE